MENVVRESGGDELKPGTTLLHGQYTIDSYLSSGGFGVTYLARDSLDRLVVIKIRIGEREKSLVAGIKAHYAPESLIGKRIVVVDNLKPATLRRVESQGMLFAASIDGELTLVTTDNPEFKPGADIR